VSYTQDDDWERWRSHFRGIRRRLLPHGPAAPVDHGGAFGRLVRVTISEDPVEIDQHPTGGPQSRKETCAICGTPTTAAFRIAASLEPEFESGLTYLTPVWVHNQCFEQCPQTNEERGVPW
jgi:hypothetical protein